MKTKILLSHIKRKALNSLMIVTLCAPTILSSSTVLAEETTPVSQETPTATTETTTETASSTNTAETSPSQEPQTTAPAITETTRSTSQNEETPTQVKAAAAAEDNVTIPDAALKQEILNALQLPAGTELTKADMEKLTSLFLNSANAAAITNLSGLETAINLSTFYLNTNNGITDFSPLEQLTSLTFVTIQTSSLTSGNFPDLSKNQGLTNLSLGSTSIDNAVLPKIAPLTQLKRLYLDSNMAITTIEPLKNMPNLSSLSVQFCGITDFTVIKSFPALIDLAATGQNTGRYDAPTDIGRSSLAYNEEAQTVFIPFEMMPNRLTNFDGFVPKFTTSNSASNTYFDFNGVQLPSTRLQITDQGITVSGVTEEEYKQINSFEYNARLNNPAGSYAKPEGFNFYAISSGTYLHQFNVYDDGAPITVRYLDEEGNALAEEKKLTGFVGKSYEVTAETIPTYQVASVEGSPSGKFTESEQTITFIYEKIKGSVVSHYVDTDGVTIKEDSILKGDLTTNFSLETPVIAGYTFSHTTGPTQGTFTEAEQATTFVYKKSVAPIGQGSVTARYLDEKGQTIKEDEQFKGTLGSPFSLKTPEISGYTFKYVTGQTQGLFTETAQTTTFVYEKSAVPINQGSVTARYLDEKGQLIKDEEHFAGALGSSYSLTTPEISGYTFKYVTGATEGTYTNSPQTTTFVYTKNLTASSDDSDPAQRSTTGNKKLPTTGEKSNNTGLLLGLVVIGISFIFAKRLKKN